jgi:HK97 family phage major capsid protein
MANLFEMKQQREVALAKADSLLKAAENAHRELNPAESAEVDTCMIAVNALNPQIKSIESRNTILKHVKSGMLIPAAPGGRGFEKPEPVTFSEDYANAFYEHIASGGKQISAALYEGSSTSGGYAVPVTVDGQIVPLAPNEMGVRKLANVIPTVMDIKVPSQASFGTAAGKAESSTSTPTSFTESDPTLGQFTLSAFMGGITHTVSWELAQDVPSFQSFAVTDMTLALQMYEENLFVNGTGTGQAQGLIGNVGVGVTEEPDSAGNLVSISGTLDILSKLNAIYHNGASWLMSRPTSIIIRKAQVQANLFEPVWTREGGQDYLHGYPVEYSTSMPAAARGAAPVLFGDFKLGYVIGDRGGSGINVKILDQPLATQGQIILLAYRRMDGRVRRSEAIQGYNVAAS